MNLKAKPWPEWLVVDSYTGGMKRLRFSTLLRARSCALPLAFWRRYLPVWLIVAGVMLGIMASLWPVSRDWEQQLGLALLYEWRGTRTPPASVVVVGIDSASAKRLGLPERPEHWPRHWHAQLIEHLHRHGAAAISLDLLFDQARNPEDDKRLTRAIAAAGNVVLVEHLHPETQHINGPNGSLTLHIERQRPPLPALAAAARATAPFPLPKVPVRTDEFWTFKPQAGDQPTFPAVALQMYADSLESPGDSSVIRQATLIDRMRARREVSAPPPSNSTQAKASDSSVGRRVVDQSLSSGRASAQSAAPLSSARLRISHALQALYSGPAVRYLNFYGPAGHLAHLPYDRALEAPASAVRGKAVFVGLTEFDATLQRDTYPTVYSNARGVDLSGVEIGATAFANLLEQSDLRRLDGLALGLSLMVWALLIALPWQHCRPSRALAFNLAASAGYVALANHLFAHYYVWLPLIAPLLLQAPLIVAMGLWSQYRRAEQQKDQLRHAFARYLPPAKLSRLTRDLGPLPPTGTVFGACLISDIADYTQLAEGLEPAALHAWMNRYLAILFPVIEAHGGIVMDATGDAVLAVWVSTRPSVPACRSAALAALELIETLARQGEIVSPTPAGSTVGMRIGLHCGEISLGALGDGAHAEYRAVGDIVNTASRIQSLNKTLGTTVLGSHEVLAALNDQPLHDQQLRAVGRFRLAGKREPVSLLELRPTTHSADAALVAGFETALKHYQSGAMALAEQAFEALLQRFPEDGPSRYYAALVRARRRSPAEVSERGLVEIGHK